MPRQIFQNDFGMYYMVLAFVLLTDQKIVVAVDQCVHYSKLNSTGICSGQVDYTFYIADGDTQSSMDLAAYLMYSETMADYSDPECQVAVQRFICARQFRPCTTVESVVPPCRSLCLAVGDISSNVCPLDMISHKLTSNEIGCNPSVFPNTGCNLMDTPNFPHPPSPVVSYDATVPSGICQHLLGDIFWSPGSLLRPSDQEEIASGPSGFGGYPPYNGAECKTAALKMVCGLLYQGLHQVDINGQVLYLPRSLDAALCHNYNSACQGLEAFISHQTGGTVSILYDCGAFPSGTQIHSHLVPFVSPYNGGVAAAEELLTVPTQDFSHAAMFVSQPVCPAPLERLTMRVDETSGALVYAGTGDDVTSTLNTKNVAFVPPTGCAVPCPFFMFTKDETDRFALWELFICYAGLLVCSISMVSFIKKGGGFAVHEIRFMACAISAALTLPIMAYSLGHLHEEYLPCESDVASQDKRGDSYCIIVSVAAVAALNVQAGYYLIIGLEFALRHTLEMRAATIRRLRILWHIAIWINAVLMAYITFDKGVLGDGGLNFCLYNAMADEEEWWRYVDGPCLAMICLGAVLGIIGMFSMTQGGGKRSRGASYSKGDIVFLVVWFACFWGWGGTKLKLDRLAPKIPAASTDYITCLLGAWGGAFGNFPDMMSENLQTTDAFCGAHLGASARYRTLTDRVDPSTVYFADFVVLGRSFLVGGIYSLATLWLGDRDAKVHASISFPATSMTDSGGAHRTPEDRGGV